MSMPSSRQTLIQFLPSFLLSPISSSSRPPLHSPLFLLCIFLFLILSPLSASGADEVSVLYTWLQSSPSPPLELSDWNPKDPTPCKWTSIACSSGSVSEITIDSIPLHLPFPSNLSSLTSLTKLTISNANLTGPIPDEIGQISSLTAIDLSSNSLSGPIPTSIGNLNSLETLILNTNQLTGKIPAQLSQCKTLRNLLLFDNKLAGTLPLELSQISSLEVIRAGGNKDINGGIPVEYGEMGNLTVLGLADTQVSGSLPSSLGKLSKLQTLSIYTTMLTGKIPAELGDCSELVNLYLYENSLSGSIPPELGKLKKLERLLLWQNSLVGSIPQEIGNCTSLVSIDFSLNSLSGTIPLSVGNLYQLQEFMISNNNVSGSIPSVFSNASNLQQLQLDTNQISGLIPPELGKLSQLTVFFAWQNQLEGNIPLSLASCANLQALDLSHNFLTGSIPPGLFQLQNLTKLLLISNEISGTIPPEIGNCTSLVRLRLGRNRITGGIPKEIGRLRHLNFLDLSSNHLSGSVPNEIGSCTQLQMLDLGNNTLVGSLPNSLSSLSSLEVLDGSRNGFGGPILASFGRLVSLTKLVLSNNKLSGSIPSSLGLCSNLQLLDLSSNTLSGDIPTELCEIEALEIALNLSWNALTGPIPGQISALDKLSILDLSHNKLSGDLLPLATLDNIVSLNVSFNNFTGYLPDTKLFRQLPQADLVGNEFLCSIAHDSCFLSNAEGGIEKGESRGTRRLKLAIALLITLTVTMVIMGIFAVLRVRKTAEGDDESELGDSWPWHFIPFQKLNFSVDQVLRCLVDSNVIGKGCSGMVYRAEMDNGEVIAVKKLWPATKNGYDNHDDDDDYKASVRDSFSAEIKTLGTIRHKNIVRFLGCCWNKRTRLLMYDYMRNGSLGSLLHERSGNALEWELRYQILLGAANGIAYLHHDCVPPIVHRDIKANNILIGMEFEPYIADFGLAKLVEDGDFARSSHTVAGSYGYIAPEYGYMMKITEKSDVYSYGVVVLEVLTGKQPIDPTIPEGLHVVDWVRQKKGGAEVLDRTLLGRPQSEIDDMMQVLGIALLCVNSSPDERPTMKDVAAMLKEIKHEREEFAKVDALLKGSPKAESESHVGGARVQAASSSSRPAVEGLLVYPKSSNNTSFSGSSLLHSSTFSG